MFDSRQRLVVLASILVSAILIGTIGWISTSTVPLIAVTPCHSEFDAGRAIQYAGVLALNFQNRVTGSDGARRAAEYLRAQFVSLGYQVEDETFAMWLEGQRVSGENVIALLPGDTPENLAVIAHYDGQRTSPQAAEDNASGVGVLLELARELRSARRARGLIFVATDAEEWGMIGARELVGFLKAHHTQAVISIDYLNAGTAPALAIDTGGQFGGHAPMWLRTVLVQSGRAQGVVVQQASGLAEVIERAVEISAQDHGPLNHAGIPAVNIETATNDSEAVRTRYHTPQDVFRDFDPSTFKMLGATVVQALTVLDKAQPQASQDESALLRSADRFLPGRAILALQLVGILPLCLAALLAARNLLAPHAAGLGKRLIAPALWIVPPAGAMLLLWGLTAAGILKRYELYPATPKDPFLYQIPAAVLWPLLLILVGGFYFAAKLQTRFAPSGLDFAARKAVLFLWLVALVGAATLRNAYAAGLFLGPLGYAALLLMPPRRWFWRILNLVLLLGAAVPFLALVVSFGVEIFLGWRILWYLVLQAAYGVWSPYSVCFFFLATALWCRLIRLSVLESNADNSRSRLHATRLLVNAL